MAKNQLTLKLYIDKHSNKIIFAEARKDVIDFIFGLLLMPLSSVTRLVSKESMVGSIGSIYKSIESMDDSYIQPNLDKPTLLDPPTTSPPLFSNADLLRRKTETVYYKCTQDCRYITDSHHLLCPFSITPMETKLSYIDGKNIKLVEMDIAGTGHFQSMMITTDDADTTAGGYVKNVGTYIIQDDLSVLPHPEVSIIALLKKFGIKALDTIDERIVEIGLQQAQELLKASLQSKNVLTDVFLQEKVSIESSRVEEENADSERFRQLKPDFESFHQLMLEMYLSHEDH